MARNGKRSPIVLCYHAVSESWRHSLSVSPATFERQIARLASVYPPLTAGEAVNAGRRGMHVTFDDAFVSVANAVPALQRLRVPATVFACTAYADAGSPLRVPELTNEADQHPAELATMRWDALRELAESGVEIGSHAITHPRLTELAQSELERELVESRTRIEDELGRPCLFLAYPYGDQDERVRAAARAAGYSAAFAMSSDLTRADRFAIPRVGIWRGDHALRAAAKIAVQHARKRPVWHPTVAGGAVSNAMQRE